MTAAQLYGNLTQLHKANFLIEFTNEGIELTPCLMVTRELLIKAENERLNDLGLNTIVTGRKYKKILIKI